MRVVLYAMRVKGGCVLWIRYPKDGNDITIKQRKNAVIFSKERDIPDVDPDHAEYERFVRETITQIRNAGLNLLNAKDFEDKPAECALELEAV